MCPPMVAGLSVATLWRAHETGVGPGPRASIIFCRTRRIFLHDTFVPSKIKVKPNLSETGFSHGIAQATTGETRRHQPLLTCRQLGHSK